LRLCKRLILECNNSTDKNGTGNNGTGKISTVINGINGEVVKNGAPVLNFSNHYPNTNPLSKPSNSKPNLHPVLFLLEIVRTHFALIIEVVWQLNNFCDWLELQ